MPRRYTAPTHDWEEELPKTQPHDWEEENEESDSSNGSSDCELDPESKFVEYMISLLRGRDLTAHDFCVLMYLAGNAGVEKAKRYGKKPESGHYSRHAKGTVPAYRDTDFLYEFEVPSKGSDGTGREPHTLVAVPGHEAICEDYETDPIMRTSLAEMVDNQELPAAYFQNPIVQAHRGDNPVVPISLFIDGTQYSNVDSAVGVWLINVVSGQRFLIAALRKRLLCDCGCRGWCTVRELFCFLHWSLVALSTGVMPGRRHDGEPFTAKDSARKAKADERLPCRACLLSIKGDWMEYVTTFGTPSWHDSRRPCFACDSSPADLMKYDGCSRAGLRWRPNEQRDYFDACEECEITVEVSEDLHARLLDVLMWDIQGRRNTHEQSTRQTQAL